MSGDAPNITVIINNSHPIYEAVMNSMISFRREGGDCTFLPVKAQNLKSSVRNNQLLREDADECLDSHMNSTLQ